MHSSTLISFEASLFLISWTIFDDVVDDGFGFHTHVRILGIVVYNTKVMEHLLYRSALALSRPHLFLRDNKILK